MASVEKHVQTTWCEIIWLSSLLLTSK